MYIYLFIDFFNIDGADNLIIEQMVKIVKIKEVIKMLTIKDLVTDYADMQLNEDVIRLFGIYEPKEVDCMMRIEDVERIANIKNGSQMIKRLKKKYDLKYDEAIIPASVFADHYGMKTRDVINFIKEKAAASTATQND